MVLGRETTTWIVIQFSFTSMGNIWKEKQEREVKFGWHRYEYIIWEMWCTGLSFFLGNDRF